MKQKKISVLTPSIRPAGLKIVQECLAKQSFKDFEWLVEIGIPETGHDLNAAFNRMLKRASGELIVFYQDYIKIQADGLEQFWNAYQRDKNTFFTAPVGKTMNWTDIQWDWRNNPVVDMNFQRWEIDWGAAPREALLKIGGFDELLDDYWSFDNVDTGLRASLEGYKFQNVWTNKAIAYDHDKLIEHPFRVKYNPEFVNQRLDEIRRGLRFNYLQ